MILWLKKSKACVECFLFGVVFGDLSGATEMIEFPSGIRGDRACFSLLAGALLRSALCFPERIRIFLLLYVAITSSCYRSVFFDWFLCPHASDDLVSTLIKGCLLFEGVFLDGALDSYTFCKSLVFKDLPLLSMLFLGDIY